MSDTISDDNTAKAISTTGEVDANKLPNEENQTISQNLVNDIEENNKNPFYCEEVVIDDEKDIKMKNDNKNKNS